MADVRRAGELIRAGQLVAFPTETVYGLGANALDERAVRRIYEAKGRPSTSPLIVHVSSVEMAQTVVAEWPDTAAALTARWWPGFEFDEARWTLPSTARRVAQRNEPTSARWYGRGRGRGHPEP